MLGRWNRYARIVILAAAPCLSIAVHAAGWTDRKEYDLVLRIRAEVSPQKRLDLLNQWKKEYPQSGQRQVRTELYLGAYQSLSDGAHMFDTAREMLTEDPASSVGAYWCTLLLPETPSTTPELLTLGEQAARRLLAAAPKYFSAGGTAAPATEEARQKQQKGVEQIANRTLAWIDWQRKDYAKAEASLTSYLTQNPNDARVSTWLAAVLAAQPQGEKQLAAIWQLTRAASLRSEGSLSDAQRRQVTMVMEKLYTLYHGSEEGLDRLRSSATPALFPPADFSIESAAVIAARRADEELAFRNPQLAAWQKIKKRLESPDGEAYFASSLRGAVLPKLKGTLLRFSPAKKPTELTLALSDSNSAEVVLQLSAPFPNEAEPGIQLDFEGTGESYTSSPFNLVLLASPDKIEGWPAPPPKHK